MTVEESEAMKQKLRIKTEFYCGGFRDEQSLTCKQTDLAGLIGFCLETAENEDVGEDS